MSKTTQKFEIIYVIEGVQGKSEIHAEHIMEAITNWAIQHRAHPKCITNINLV